MERKDALWVVLGDTEQDAFGLVAKGVGLARERQMVCDVVLVKAALTCAEQNCLSRMGTRRIYHLPADPQSSLCERAVCETLVRTAQEEEPKAMLFLSSLFFHAVAPGVAAALHTGITADCTDLKWSGASLLQGRPAFGGKTLAVIRTRTLPVLATVRRGVFSAKGIGTIETKLSAEVRRIPLLATTQPFQILLFNNAREAPEDLQRAKLVFAGGAGMGSRERFQTLYRLAALTGGQVAASRGAVAAGFAPYSLQVGQTGLTIRPALYIAFGISGAVQHLSGMIDAEYIVSVNSDPNAPIHQISNYAVCADAQTVITGLINALEKNSYQ